MWTALQNMLFYQRPILILIIMSNILGRFMVIFGIHHNFIDQRGIFGHLFLIVPLRRYF